MSPHMEHQFKLNVPCSVDDSLKVTTDIMLLEAMIMSTCNDRSASYGWHSLQHSGSSNS